MVAERRLSPIEAPWLIQDGFLRIVAALERDGDRVRVTGGAVRDTLVGAAEYVDDLDLVGTMGAAEARGRLEAAGLKASVHPFMPDVLFVDLPRSLRDASHASVQCLADRSDQAFRSDAANRDFTVNALHCAPDGTIEDHVGGLVDAGSRTLRFVSGDVAAADPVRLLRYFRMRIRLGEGEPHPDALAIVRRNAHLLRTGQGIRAIRELSILIDGHTGDEVLAALKLMRRTGVLDVILPRADLERFRRYLGETRLGMGADAFQALALLGAANDTFLAWGDSRDEMIAMRAAAFDVAGDDLSLGAVSDSFHRVVRDWKERRPEGQPLPA